MDGECVLHTRLCGLGPERTSISERMRIKRHAIRVLPVTCEDLLSIAVPKDEQTPKRHTAITELLGRVTPLADALGRVFSAAGHELALVGGPVRDALLGRPVSDLDFATDAKPERILKIVDGWADAVWTIG